MIYFIQIHADTNTDEYVILYFYLTTILCPKTIQLMLSEDQSIVVEFQT